jgi:hypothetical protein
LKILLMSLSVKDQAPLAGVVMCCTSIAPEQRVCLSSWGFYCTVADVADVADCTDAPR